MEVCEICGNVFSAGLVKDCLFDTETEFQIVQRACESCIVYYDGDRL